MNQKNNKTLQAKRVGIYYLISLGIKQNKDVSIGGSILIDNEAASPKSIDGAKISIKVKTGQ